MEPSRGAVPEARLRKLIYVLAAVTLLVFLGCSPLFWQLTGTGGHPIPPSRRMMVIAQEDFDRNRLGRRVRAMVANEDFDGVDRMADSLYTHDVRWWSGAPRFVTCIQRGCDEVEDPKDAGQWQQLLADLRAWNDGRPESKWATIALAGALTARGWAARGQGPAFSVSEKHATALLHDCDEARSLLLRCPAGVRDNPLWYEALMRADHALGADSEYRAVMQEGIEKFPDYHRFYGMGANHLLPRWYGEPGDIARFGEAFASALPDSVGDEYYARMVAYLVGLYGPDALQDLKGYSPRRTQLGLERWHERWPRSSQPMSLLAMLACEWNEPAVARQAFEALGDTLDIDVWGSRSTYEEYRDIAYSEPKEKQPS